MQLKTLKMATSLFTLLDGKKFLSMGPMLSTKTSSSH